MGPEAQLDGFIAKFAPQNQKLIRASRQAIAPPAPSMQSELVYDNYNFLVLAYCPSERTKDSFFSLGANAWSEPVLRLQRLGPARSTRALARQRQVEPLHSPRVS